MQTHECKLLNLLTSADIIPLNSFKSVPAAQINTTSISFDKEGLSIYASVNVLRELAYSSKNYFCKVWIPKHSYLAEIEIIIHKIDIKN